MVDQRSRSIESCFGNRFLAPARCEVIHAYEVMLEGDGQCIGLHRQDLQAQALGFVDDLVARPIEVPVKPGRDGVRHELFSTRATLSAPQCNPPVLFIQGLPPQRVDGVMTAAGAALEAIAGTCSPGTAC